MEKMRTTMKLSLSAGLPMCLILFLTADWLLNLFGEHYAEQAAWCLRILSLGVFPLIVKYHYVALLRVYNQLDNAIRLFFVGSLLEIIFVVVGLEVGALTGLSIGWLAAVSVEAALMYYRMSRHITEESSKAEVLAY
jgi:O-antigen/teichoic acid export membrane protein